MPVPPQGACWHMPARPLAGALPVRLMAAASGPSLFNESVWACLTDHVQALMHTHAFTFSLSLSLCLPLPLSESESLSAFSFLFPGSPLCAIGPARGCKPAGRRVPRQVDAIGPAGELAKLNVGEIGPAVASRPDRAGECQCGKSARSDRRVQVCAIGPARGCKSARSGRRVH